jgi:hypothetical protein
MATGFSATPTERSTCLARPLNLIVVEQSRHHQLLIVRLGVKVGATALDRLLLQLPLPVAVRSLDRAFFMGHSAVIAAGDDPQVGAEFVVAAGVVAGVRAVTVAVAGTEAVGAVFRRHPTAERKGLLESF